jgi:hypothetical protein
MVPSALTVKVPPQAVLRQFVSISDDSARIPLVSGSNSKSEYQPVE